MIDKLNTALMKTMVPLLFLFPSYLFAQNIELAGISYLHSSATWLQDGESAQIEELNSFVKYPHKLKSDAFIITEIRYGLKKIGLNKDDYFNNENYVNSYHRFALSLAYLKPLKKKWSGVAYVQPIIASDFSQSLNTDALSWLSSLLFYKTFNSNRFGGGIGFTSQTGEPFYFPVLVLYAKHKKHEFDMLLPLYLDYDFQLDKEGKFLLGWSSRFEGSQFQSFEKDAVRSTSGRIDFVRYHRIVGGLNLTARPKKNIELEFMAGKLINAELLVGENPSPSFGSRRHSIQTGDSYTLNVGVNFILPSD